MNFKVNKSEEEWRKELTEEEYRILREKGTEAAFSGEYDKSYNEGMYHCKACDTMLFDSESKFDSGCGWPSFDKSLGKDKVLYQEDRSHGMIRTEIVCGNCGSHLGHVFNDGPTETGTRYCVNSASLNFQKED